MPGLKDLKLRIDGVKSTESNKQYDGSCSKIA